MLAFRIAFSVNSISAVSSILTIYSIFTIFSVRTGKSILAILTVFSVHAVLSIFARLPSRPLLSLRAAQFFQRHKVFPRFSIKILNVTVRNLHLNFVSCICPASGKKHCRQQ